MPELPEVEVLVRALRPRLEGRRIERVRILRDQLVASPRPRTFATRLRRRRITLLRRRGKTIWAELDDGGHWLTHLRMTGWWRHHPQPRAPADRHVLAVITLDRGQLHFRDPRRFGRMWWVRDPGPHFAALGPEPLERAFTTARLHRRLARRRAAVKQALLDPGVVAGVGNIYASEACYLAGLDPRTPAHRLGPDDVRGLRRALRDVLRRAIRLGSTVAPVVDGHRARAGFREEFAVYRRAGEPCRRCGSAIERVVIGQRGTFLCPACQRLLEEG
ncbi:MAG: bifunctional DNA-formamidopyrimidine glycosylase/DNA-(apurinic or apyrimidinic site) lyase [Planctomycetota bacterium]|jgi:formamidopyrimidine-DNA glycosylase